MELVDYLRLLRRRLVYILLALIAGTIGGLGVSHGQTATYSSTLRIFVSTASPNPAGVFESLSQVAGSSPVIAQAEAVAKAKSGVAVTAGAEGAASVIAITVSSKSPETAAGVAAAYATVLPAAYSQLDTITKLVLRRLDQSPVVASALHKNRTIGIGAVLGLVAGLAAALLRDALDRSIRDPDDLAARLGTPLQGVIPSDRVSSGIVTLSRPRSARAEAFRRLGASLRLNPGGGLIKTLLVTSAVTREGKTTAALNLAAAASGSGEEVLVIDADLRRPSIHNVLNLENTSGLSDVLARRVPNETSIVHDGPGFDVMLSGSDVTNPVEILRGPEFATLLGRLRPTYDLIIIDAPAALGVADAEVIGAASDAVLFVSRLGATPRGRSKAAVNVLNQGGSRLWGVVATFAAETDPLPKPLRRVGRAAGRTPSAKSVQLVQRPERGGAAQAPRTDRRSQPEESAPMDWPSDPPVLTSPASDELPPGHLNEPAVPVEGHSPDPTANRDPWEQLRRGDAKDPASATDLGDDT